MNKFIVFCVISLLSSFAFAENGKQPATFYSCEGDVGVHMSLIYPDYKAKLENGSFTMGGRSKFDLIEVPEEHLVIWRGPGINGKTVEDFGIFIQNEMYSAYTFIFPNNIWVMTMSPVSKDKFVGTMYSGSYMVLFKNSGQLYRFECSKVTDFEVNK